MVRLESQHLIAFPPEEIWPALSNTDWLNRSLGLPPVTYITQPRPEGGSHIQARARLFGLEMRWREFPFEWLEPEFYRVRRVFETGPFREARIGMELLPRPNKSTQVVAWSELLPRSALGRLLANRLLGPKTRRDMQRIFAHLESSLRAKASVPLPNLPVHPVNEPALQTGLEKLRATGQPAASVRQLENFLRQSPDVELGLIRPFAIARRWQTDPWETLELFLHATRSGLVDLGWELLCPNCRSSPLPPALSLEQLRNTSHCDVCQIKYDAEFDKSVELKFTVNPAIRPPDQQTYCLVGPGGKPHVLSQLWLEPGEEKLWKLPSCAHARACRLQSPQVKETKPLPPEAPPAGQRLAIICEAAGFIISREPDESRPGLAHVKNPNSFPIRVSLEQTQWSDDILTAARVTNWQSFRDLFASEVISPTEQITVGSQVILFTDLRGSTAMYHGLGDAPAYTVVRNHFAVLLAAVRAHHGAVIKTIGDAVMASFSRVDEALAAVEEMHAKLPTVSSANTLLALKSSLHVGPCLAVNANNRLDFFGSTVNLAARMVGCCQGGDLTVSDELFHRPEMAKFLSTRPPPQPAEIKFRGFDIPHRVWRIPMTTG